MKVSSHCAVFFGSPGPYILVMPRSLSEKFLSKTSLSSLWKLPEKCNILEVVFRQSDMGHLTDRQKNSFYEIEIQIQYF